MKIFPGIFADCCYLFNKPTIVAISADYKHVTYYDYTSENEVDETISEYNLLFLRTASSGVELRSVAQLELSQHVNKLAIIYADGKIKVTEHNCSGEQGAYIQYRDGKFTIYNKIDGFHYIILEEDGSYTTYPVPFPGGTAQGIIDVLYDYPSIPDGTIFWGDKPAGGNGYTRYVNDLLLLYPVYKNGVNFGQEYSKVERLPGVKDFNQNFLLLDNKLGKYPHLATDGNQSFLACWAELGGIIGATELPPYPPYTPPVVIEPEPPIVIPDPIPEIPTFEKSNHLIEILLAGEPNAKKRLTWLDSESHPHRNDTNKTEENVVGILCTLYHESIDEAEVLARLLSKPIHLYRDHNEWDDMDETIAQNLEDKGIKIIRSWDGYFRKEESWADQYRKQIKSIERAKGECAPWLGFYRQIFKLDPPTYNLTTQQVIDQLENMWNDIYRNESKITMINGMEFSRANALDGTVKFPSLNECYERMVKAGDWKKPDEIPPVINPPVDNKFVKLVLLLKKIFGGRGKGRSKKEGKGK